MNALSVMLTYRMAEVQLLADLLSGAKLDEAKETTRHLLAPLAKKMEGWPQIDLPRDKEVLAHVSFLAGDGRSLVERLIEGDKAAATAWVAKLAHADEHKSTSS